MGEYEDRYPEAYGHGESEEVRATNRHFLDLGVAHPVRDDPVTTSPGTASPDPTVERPVARLVERGIVRSPREICDDVYEQLGDSPYIDATGITVAVTDTEVTLEGVTESQIEVSLARALALNTAGVSGVRIRLRVAPPMRRYATALAR